jgi:hypothetical protein
MFAFTCCRDFWHGSLCEERLRIFVATEIVNPHGRINNDHVRSSSLAAAHTRLIEVAFPTHLAPKPADGALGVCLRQQSQACFHRSFLGTSPAELHRLAHQTVVDVNISSHEGSS